MSLWCILAAPLFASNDLTKMTPETLAILSNPEAIAVDQDPKGMQGHRVWQEGPLEIWAKPLSDGSKAVALFNREEHPMTISLNLGDIGFSGSAKIRDLWQRKDLGTFSGSFTVGVPKHGSVLLKIQ